MKHPPILVLENTRASTFFGALFEIIYFGGFNNLNLLTNIPSNDDLYYKNDPLVDFYFILDESGTKIDIYEGKLKKIKTGTIVAKTGTGFCRLVYSYINGLKKKREYEEAKKLDKRPLTKQ